MIPAEGPGSVLRFWQDLWVSRATHICSELMWWKLFVSPANKMKGRLWLTLCQHQNINKLQLSSCCRRYNRRSNLKALEWRCRTASECLIKPEVITRPHRSSGRWHVNLFKLCKDLNNVCARDASARPLHSVAGATGSPGWQRWWRGDRWQTDFKTGRKFFPWCKTLSLFFSPA